MNQFVLFSYLLCVAPTTASLRHKVRHIHICFIVEHVIIHRMELVAFLHSSKLNSKLNTFDHSVERTLGSFLSWSVWCWMNGKADCFVQLSSCYFRRPYCYRSSDASQEEVFLAGPVVVAVVVLLLLLLSFFFFSLDFPLSDLSWFVLMISWQKKLLLFFSFFLNFSNSKQ